MMQRRIFPWMGLIVLFLLFVIPEGFASENYTVARGDTLSGIAKQLGVSAQALRKANNLRGNALKPSQVLVVPLTGETGRTLVRKSPSRNASAQYVIKKGDTVSHIANKTGVPAGEIMSLNHLRTRSLKPGTVLILSGRSTEQILRKKDAGHRIADGDRGEENEVGNAAADVTAANDPEDSGNAELLGTWKNTEERQLFIRVATGFLGAPYRLGGSSVKGLDCSAFVRKIYDFFGITLPRTAHEQARIGISVLREELEAGDLVFFNTRKWLGHVGIYIGNNEFVHASSRNKGVRIDSLKAPYYDRHFVKAVRLKGLDGDT